MGKPRLAAPAPAPPPVPPSLSEQPSRFMSLEREVERECRPQMLARLQEKVNAVAEEARGTPPLCPQCARPMGYRDTRQVSWLAHWGRLRASASRYRCAGCKQERRPLLDLLGVEPGRISGSPARLLALPATEAPYELAARLTGLPLGVDINTMRIWRLAQRLGQAAANYGDALSQVSRRQPQRRGAGGERATGGRVGGRRRAYWECKYARSGGAAWKNRRRRRCRPWKKGSSGRSKRGCSYCPGSGWKTSPGRRSVVRRFPVACLGDADEIFRRLYGQLREFGWVGEDTVVAIVGDGAEWIWNRATLFVRRCEILDFRHTLEHAWGFARLRYGVGSTQADAWVHGIAEDLRAGEVDEAIARLKRRRPKTPEMRDSLRALIRYYSENAGRMRYDEYLRRGYGIGGGAVESAHKKVVHARFRQAGMRWSQAEARRLLYITT